MHYIPQPTQTEIIERAKRFVGKYVRATTYPDQIWEVKHAYPLTDGVIRLSLRSLDGGTLWMSDNEHATIVSMGDYSPTYEINPLNRGELIESDENEL